MRQMSEEESAKLWDDVKEMYKNSTPEELAKWNKDLVKDIAAELAEEEESKS